MVSSAREPEIWHLTQNLEIKDGDNIIILLYQVKIDTNSSLKENDRYKFFTEIELKMYKLHKKVNHCWEMSALQ